MVTSAKVLLLIEVQGALGLDNYCLSYDRICWLTIPPHLAIVDLIRDFFYRKRSLATDDESDCKRLKVVEDEDFDNLIADLAESINEENKLLGQFSKTLKTFLNTIS